MRRVSQKRVSRRISAQWLRSARVLLDSMAVATSLQRARIIKKNSALWSEIKDALWHAGGEKCWFSEVELSIGEVEVEHFRPKGRVCGVRHGGYWWLAFDWRNYRLASHLVNTRKTDPINKGLRGKGTYFPLVAGVRGNYINPPPPSDPLCVNGERALLLDPIDAMDVKKLIFDQDGLPGPHPVHCKNATDVQRVNESIEFYALDDGVLNGRRADVWRNILIWCEQIETILSEVGDMSEARQNRFNDLINFISDSIDQGAEFSAAALAALRSWGDRGWNTELIQATDP